MEKKIPKEFWEDMNWGRKNYPKLTKKYPDKWIAISNKKVIVADEDLGRVEDIAREKLKGKQHIPYMFVECGAHIY